MKNNLLILTALGGIFFTSCKNEVQKNSQEEIVSEETQNNHNDINSLDTVCYSFISEKDTVKLKMKRRKDEITGSLSYSYFEKDKNTGTFKGTFENDTLRAVYTFNSEGTESVREILFFQKGNKLIEGFGEVEEVNGKMKFKKGATFSLNKNMPLRQVECGN